MCAGVGNNRQRQRDRQRKRDRDGETDRQRQSLNGHQFPQTSNSSFYPQEYLDVLRNITLRRHYQYVKLKISNNSDNNDNNNTNSNSSSSNNNISNNNNVLGAFHKSQCSYSSNNKLYILNYYDKI